MSIFAPTPFARPARFSELTAWLVGLTLIGGLSVFPTGALAQSDGPPPPSNDQEVSAQQEEKFKELVDKGKVHFAKNNYEKALGNFEQAYQIKQTPNLLFNMGLVAEKSGNLATALDYYKTFVVSPNVSLDLRDKAQKRIKVIEPIVEDQKEDERKAREQRATEEEPESLAGTDKESDSSGGDEQDDDATAATDTGGASGGGSAAGGLLLTSGGVAAIGGGVIFTLLGQQARNTFATADGLQARRSAQQAAYMNQWYANGLFVAGLGAATAGVVVLLNRSDSEESTSPAALQPTLGPDFAGLRFQTDF